VQQFKDKKEQRLSDLGVTVGEPDGPHEDTDEKAAMLPRSSSSKYIHEKDHDDAADVMVEAEEDTVIY
jgi:hypothetical protein